MTGFLRLSTRRGIFAHPLSAEDALAFMDEWLAHPHVNLLLPGERHAALLGRLLIGAGRGGNLVSHAHLAAIAIEHGAILGSFETAFERFAGLHFVHLPMNVVHEPRS